MIKEKISIIKRVKILVSLIREIVKENDMEIAFSGTVIAKIAIVMTRLKNYCAFVTIAIVMMRLKNYCAFVAIALINNVNVDDSCLNRSRLHLNCKDSKNLGSCIKLKVD